MHRELLPGGTDALALRVVLRFLRELFQALRYRRDADAWVEVVALEGVVHGSKITLYARRVQGGKRVHRSAFFYVRVAVLLAILFGVLLWAWRDIRTRRARNEWDHTLDVAVVLVRLDRVDDGAFEAIRARLPAVEAHLDNEMRRYRRSGPRPFALHAVGPAKAIEAPPSPLGDGPIDAARHSIALASWTREVDSRAGVEPSAYDVRIYVVAREPRSAERTLVEGRGEQGGRIGVVEVELDESMADLALIVACHELLHTLGATDKYDARGSALVPDGLAEPDRRPLFPQRFAEIMARNRPLDSAGAEAVPDRFDDVAVGRVTAREIGWPQ